MRILGASGCTFCPRVREFGNRQGTYQRRHGDALRVWTNDYETTYPTAQLHPRYLAASTAEACYDVVFEYTVFLVSNFLRRVDGAFFGQFRGCGRRVTEPPLR